MKRTRIFLLIIVLLLTLTSCEQINPVERTVVNALKAFQQFDTDKIQYYWGDIIVIPNIPGVDEQDILQDIFSFVNQKTENVLRAYFSKMTYRINSSEIDEENNTATVNVNITSVDISGKLHLLMIKIFTSSLKVELDIEKTIIEFIEELANEEKPDLFSKTVNISLYKENDEWKIQRNTDAINAIFGGLLYALEGLK